MCRYDIFTGLLKAFPLPLEQRDVVDFSFDFGHLKYEVLKSKYPIVEVAGGGDDFSRAVNLLGWVAGNIYHKGNYSGSMPANAISYLDYAFGKDEAQGINCVALSTVLSDCLMAIGIKARKVFIMPCSPYDGDNHVVAEAYSKEMGKWVMLDPTLNAYFKNEQNNCLSLLELRQHLADQAHVFFNKEAKYNDKEWTEESAQSNIEYLAKNLFYFQLAEINTFNDENDPIDVTKNRVITLCPQGFNPKQTRISNVEYRKRKYGEQPWMAQVLEHEKTAKYFFCATPDFE